MNILLILLGILKVIGIIIGIILALILIILMVIMFSPIRYRIEAERYENIKGEAEVKWIFGIIKAFVSVTSDFDVKYTDKIFHKKFDNSDNDKKTEKDENRNNSKTIEAMEKKSENKETDVKVKKPQENNKTIDKNISNTENKEIKKTVIKEEKKVSQPVRRVNVSDIENKNVKIESKKTNENNKKLYKEEKEDSIIKKLNAIENKKEILKATILFIKRIFKGILPKNIYANMEIGAGEPYLTGYIMGVYGVGKSKYGDSINIKPYFEGFKIEGIFKAKGKIIIGKLLFDTARFVFTKPVFVLIKNILKGNVI